MGPAAPVRQQSLLYHFIQVGGPFPLVIVFLALILTLWGLINLAVVKNRFALGAQALLSFAPLTFALFGLILAFREFQTLANAPGPGDPVKIADLMFLAFVLGFVGSISTAIPAILGILALVRNVRPPARPTGKNVVGDL